MKKLVFKSLAAIAVGATMIACGSPSESKKSEKTTEAAAEAPIEATATVAEVTTMENLEGSIAWEGAKVTGKHNGTVDFKSNSLKFQGDEWVGGEFVVDMTSIKVLDLEGEWKDKLEGHLNSDDFFSTTNNPEAKMVIKSVSKDGDKYNAVGDLTIKGITVEQNFVAEKMMNEDGSKGLKADIIIDRTKYDIKYGSGSFFDDLGDKTIDDDFKLMVSVKM